MTRAKRPVLSLLISLVGFLGLAFVVWKIPPGNWLIESAVLLLLAITITLIMAWLIGNSKRGILVAVTIMGLLLMRRLGILDWLTMGLWLLVLGLISLII